MRTMDITVTHSRKSDSLMYNRFKSNFAVPKLSLVGEKGFKLCTEKWRSILVASEGMIKDHSTMTLLRSSHLDPFWVTQLDSCGGLLVVPRAQWQFVEIARCREGYYGLEFRRMLEGFDLGTYAEEMDGCRRGLREGGGEGGTKRDEAIKIVEKVRREYPLPKKSALSKSGIGKSLKRLASALALESSNSPNPALELLEMWRHGVALGDMVGLGGPTGDAARFALKAVMREAKVGGGGEGSRRLEASNVTRGQQEATCNVSGKSDDNAAAVFHENGVVYHPEPVLSSEEVRELSEMAEVRRSEKRKPTTGRRA